MDREFAFDHLVGRESKAMVYNRIFAKPSLLFALVALAGCNSADESQVQQVSQNLTVEEERTIRFEDSTDWQLWAGNGTLANSTTASEGTYSLSVSNLDYAAIRNSTVLTKDEQAAPQVVGYDVLIPVNQVNPWWNGETQLYIDAPSAGVWNQFLGIRSFQNEPKGEFTRFEFPVPDWIRQNLDNSNYTDLRFTIVLNVVAGSDTHYIDDFTLGPVTQGCTPVDDGNECTADTCDAGTGQTTHTPVAPGTLCTSDGDACNGIEACDGAGVCAAGEAPEVDDGNTCTSDSCDPAVGVINTPVAQGTACADSDLCNGNEVCSVIGVCESGSALIVDDGNACTVDSCDAVTGIAHAPVSAGTTCADGDVCNGDEVCDAAGSCEAGTPLEADDGNACTADSCDAIAGVNNTPEADGFSCDDGDLCNGLSLCDGASTCVAGTPPTVDDGNVCTTDSCDPSMGVIHASVGAGTSCGDGNACNGDELCDGAGSCQVGTGPELDDGNPCTADACDGGGGVTHTPVAVGTNCGDGGACNNISTCDASGACVAGLPHPDQYPCGDDGDNNVCTMNLCNGAGTCENVIDPYLDDGSVCTIDECDPITGTTHTDIPVGPQDDNPCTIKYCHWIDGVVTYNYLSDYSCADDNLCNGAEFCDGAGTCGAGTAVSAGVSCGDADLCNGAEVCDGAGACDTGTPIETDDGNTCTIGSCDPGTGMVSQVPAPLNSPCGDGDLCNGSEFCDGAGVCDVGTPLNPDDGNPCTVDSCDPVFGAENDPAASGLSCTDGDVCNGDEACDGFGTCSAGSPLLVDDGNECTSDTCDAVAGVSHDNAPQGTTCGLDSTCNGTGSCADCVVGSPLSTCPNGLSCSPSGTCEPFILAVNAPDLPATGFVSLKDITEFLYQGTDPIQKGLDSSILEEKRISNLAGQVFDEIGQPLPGVLVDIVDRSEFGYTYTREDGRFDLVLNGGGQLRVRYRMPTRLPAQRSIVVPWNEFAHVPDVVLIGLDDEVETIVMESGTLQTAGASVLDDRGPRNHELLFGAGVSGEMVAADGTRSPLSTMDVRITEYTVGELGPQRMPATLPPSSDYTLAFEVSVDEALAVGAVAVEFSEPVIHYVENFIGIPVGEPVPVATFDRARGLWLPDPDGKVVEILSFGNGRANLDIDGSGTIATPSALEALGVSDEELVYLAGRYPLGQSLWRTPLTHFSTKDLNYGSASLSGGPGGGTGPGGGSSGGGLTGSGGGGGGGGGCVSSGSGAGAVGSQIDIENRALGETIPLVGTPLSLRYDSKSSRGGLTQLRIRATLDEVDPEVIEVRVRLRIAGQAHEWVLPPDPNQEVTFNWDGKDGFGRLVPGQTTAWMEIEYTVAAYALIPGTGSETFGVVTGQFYEPMIPVGDMQFTSQYWAVMGAGGLEKTADIGGWVLSQHHAYEHAARRVLRGDGRVEEAVQVGEEEARWDTSGSSLDCRRMAQLPNGDVLCASINAIYKMEAGENTMVRIAGYAGAVYGSPSGDAGAGDGLPIDVNGATRFPDIKSLAVGPDGSIYVGNRWRVRRIDPNGIIQTIAGATASNTAACPEFPADGVCGTGGPALEATFTNGGVEAIAAGHDGSVYLYEFQNYGLIRRIRPDGILELFMGDGDGNYGWNLTEGDTFAGFTANWGRHGMGVAPDGTLYASDSTQVIGLGADGIFHEIASHYDGPNCLDGVFECYQGEDPAKLKGGYAHNGGFAVAPSGRIFVSYDDHIASFMPGGTINIEGTNPTTRYAASGSSLAFPHGTGPIAVGPAGLAVARKRSSNVPSDEPTGEMSIYRVALNSIDESNEFSFPDSQNTHQKFVFDHLGHHLRTELTSTGAVVWAFDYSTSGSLSGITDAFGQRTSIERDGDGVATAIVAPHGQRTELLLDVAGKLETVTGPDGSVFSMTYQTSGGISRLGSFTDRAGRMSTFEFDALGYLTSDTAFHGGVQTLSSLGDPEFDPIAVSHTSAMGFETTVDGPTGDVGGDSLYSVAYSDGTSRSNSYGLDGVNVVTSRDGSQTTTTLSPDPVRGNSTSYVTLREVALPISGLQRVTTRAKVAVMDSGELVSSSEVQCIESTNGQLCSSLEHDLSTGMITRTSPEGRVTTELLDALERLVEVRPPGAPVIRVQYEGEHITALIIDPDGIEGNGDERSSTMVYDAATGLLTKIIDPLTHETLFTNYDGADRPGTIILPDAAQVKMTYDTEGNVASVTPPGKGAHGMTYGPRGRIESYTPPVGNSVSFQYDLDRRMDVIDFGLDALGQPNQMDFDYDAVTGQLAMITSPAGVIDVGFTDGHMTSLTAPSIGGGITTSIDYDGFLPTSLSWAGTVAGEVNWTYNDRFLIESETIGALPETTVNYTYDDDGLVTQAGDLAIARDPASGRVISKTIGNIRETFEYNEFAELSRQTVDFMELDGVTAKETLYDVIYDDDGVNGDRDALGRITSKTEWIVEVDTPGAEPRTLTSRTYDYGYNQDGRPWLESVAVDGSVVSSYGYDDNGNRTSVELNWSQLGYDTKFDASLTEADTAYDSADELLTYGTKSYEWNNFGQLQSMTDSDPDGDAVTTDSETTFYEYDLSGNLLSVALPDGRTIEYEVDGAGRRVGRRELDSDDNQMSFKGWIYRDLLRPIAEVDETGVVVARYIYSDGSGTEQNGVKQLSTQLGANQDTSLPFAGSNVPEVIELVDGAGVVTQTLSLSTNQVGSVQLVIDADTGDVVQRVEYDSFGRVVFDSAPGFQPFGFAGGLVDEASGLVRFGARDYSADVGRWLTRDPVRFAGGQQNLYVYLNGNVVNGMDSSGLQENERGGYYWECRAEYAYMVAASIAVAATCITPEIISKLACAAALTNYAASLVAIDACIDEEEKKEEEEEKKKCTPP